MGILLPPGGSCPNSGEGDRGGCASIGIDKVLRKQKTKKVVPAKSIDRAKDI